MKFTVDLMKYTNWMAFSPLYSNLVIGQPHKTATVSIPPGIHSLAPGCPPPLRPQINGLLVRSVGGFQLNNESETKAAGRCVGVRAGAHYSQIWVSRGGVVPNAQITTDELGFPRPACYLVTSCDVWDTREAICSRETNQIFCLFGPNLSTF